MSLHVCVCVLWSRPKFRRVWPWVILRNEAEASLKVKTISRKMTRRRCGTEPGLDCPFCISTLWETVYFLELCSCRWSSHFTSVCLNCTVVWVPFILRVQHGPAKTESLRKQKDGEYGWMESAEIQVICKFKKKSTWLFLASVQPSPCKLAGTNYN